MAIAIACIAIGPAQAEKDPAARQESVRQTDVSAYQRFLAHARAIAGGLTSERFRSVTTPEDFCWLDFPRINLLLTAWELSGDRWYGREAGRAIRDLIGVMERGPDGRLGWYGLPIASLADPANPDARVREIQTDFRAVGVISRFLRMVSDDPVLQSEFILEQADWIALMQNDLVAYWDPYFQDLGDRGAIYQWNSAYRPTVARLTLAHEKLSIMVGGLLALAELTGKPEPAWKAAKIGLWFRTCLHRHGNHYAWSRWSPAGPWDVHPDDPNRWKTWIGADPKAEWYAAAVSIATSLHRVGLVFSEVDVARLVATQKEVCWNGDFEHPRFFKVDGLPADAGEVFLAASLAPFDKDIYNAIYGASGIEHRARVAGDPWKGGVLAGEWFLGKVRYRELPAGSVVKALVETDNRFAPLRPDALPDIGESVQTNRAAFSIIKPEQMRTPLDVLE